MNKRETNELEPLKPMLKIYMSIVKEKHEQRHETEDIIKIKIKLLIIKNGMTGPSVVA